MQQNTACNHQPCHSYCVRVGENAAVEGCPPAQRAGVGALAPTNTASTPRAGRAS